VSQPGPTEQAPADRIPPRVLASWERSRCYGVATDDVDPVFSGTLDHESLFFECGQEVLSGLHETLATEPVSLMLTDADGLVLNRLSGDHSLLRALDAVHLAPGFAYSERDAGTNGLGLALADRMPSLVRAEEHYALSLRTYTCAAAPVIDPVTGHVEGSINLTTWSESSHELLLALAQAAAGNTAALMLARSEGRRSRPAPRGEVFRVQPPRLEPGAGALTTLSDGWQGALAQASQGLAAGRVVAAVGEPGVGRTTLLAQAERITRPRERILAASPPAPADAEVWLSLWTPELGKPHTAVIGRNVDQLPTWVAERLRDIVLRARAQLRSVGGGADAALPFSVTAERFEDIPAPLSGIVETIVQVPPLRDRPEDILPLVEHASTAARGRPLRLTPSAQQAVTSYGWPGNVDQLQRVMKSAARRSDVVDIRHLPPEILTDGSRRLTRIEGFERDEIVRVVSRAGISMKDAAVELGIGRATLYRKIAQYGIRVPRTGAFH
jgi:sigma-54 dependent transcriptional regulator, acetoin dehydrogenase operon transcriptional activator AcoR